MEIRSELIIIRIKFKGNSKLINFFVEVSVRCITGIFNLRIFLPNTSYEFISTIENYESGWRKHLFKRKFLVFFLEKIKFKFCI